MAELQLISSDSHVSEPPDLWVQRIDKKYQDRAPKVVLNPEGQEGAYLVYEGYPPHNFSKLAPTPTPAREAGTRPNGCRIWSWMG
jgi:hypothetical protein